MLCLSNTLIKHLGMFGEYSQVFRDVRHNQGEVVVGGVHQRFNHLGVDNRNDNVLEEGGDVVANNSRESCHAVLKHAVVVITPSRGSHASRVKLGDIVHNLVLHLASTVAHNILKIGQIPSVQLALQNQHSSAEL